MLSTLIYLYYTGSFNIFLSNDDLTPVKVYDNNNNSTICEENMCYCERCWTGLKCHLNTTCYDFAFVTMATTPDSYASALALIQSAREVKSEYPFVILVGGSITDRQKTILMEQNLNVLQVINITKFIPVSSKFKPAAGARWITALSKLLIWKLTQFKKLIWIDSDAYFYSNADDMFQLPELTGQQNYDASCPPNPKVDLNSGVLVLEPNINTYKGLLYMFENSNNSWHGGDQELIGTYFSSLSKLHISSKQVNTMVYCCWQTWWNETLIKTIHFTQSRLYTNELLKQDITFPYTRYPGRESCEIKFNTLWKKLHYKALSLEPYHISDYDGRVK